MRQIYYGWTRNDDGGIDNWHPCEVSNTITTFVGGGWNTSPKIAVIYESR